MIDKTNSIMHANISISSKSTWNIFETRSIKPIKIIPIIPVPNLGLILIVYFNLTPNKKDEKLFNNDVSMYSLYLANCIDAKLTPFFVSAKLTLI